MAFVFPDFAPTGFTRLFSRSVFRSATVETIARSGPNNTRQRDLWEMMDRNPDAFESDLDVMALANLYAPLF